MKDSVRAVIEHAVKRKRADLECAYDDLRATEQRATELRARIETLERELAELNDSLEPQAATA